MKHNPCKKRPNEKKTKSKIFDLVNQKQVCKTEFRREKIAKYKRFSLFWVLPQFFHSNMVCSNKKTTNATIGVPQAVNVGSVLLLCVPSICVPCAAPVMRQAIAVVKQFVSRDMVELVLGSGKYNELPESVHYEFYKIATHVHINAGSGRDARHETSNTIKLWADLGWAKLGQKQVWEDAEFGASLKEASLRFLGSSSGLSTANLNHTKLCLAVLEMWYVAVGCG